jgi:hypothetical protein
MSVSREKVLRELLTVLVSEWGPVTVRRVLDVVGSGAQTNASGGRSAGKQRAPRRKITALEYTAGADLPAGRRDTLAELALRFDQKRFLPTASDVRYFFEMRGERPPPAAKHRPETFKPVLQLLLKMPQDEVEALLRNGAHSGPSQLGPLADAIRDASASLRSERQATPENAPGLPFGSDQGLGARRNR